MRITCARKMPCPPEAAKKASGSNSSSSALSWSSSRASAKAALAAERRSSTLAFAATFAFGDLLVSGPLDPDGLAFTAGAGLAFLMGFFAATGFLAATFLVALAGCALAATLAGLVDLEEVFAALLFFFTAINASYDKVSLGAPMSTPSLQKMHSYHDVTQQANELVAGSQLQKIRCLRHRESGNWIFDFEFYPFPRRALWVSDGKHGSWGWLTGVRLPEKAYMTAQNPLFLYLKSHFLGRRLNRLSATELGESLWDFGEGYLWRMRFHQANGVLSFSIEVPHKKVFTKELKLCPASSFEESVSEEPTTLPSASALKPSPRHDRLLENIRSDLTSAKEWLSRYSSLCLELERRPWLWHQNSTEEKDAIWSRQIEKLQQTGLLPKNRDSTFLKSALDKLFNERSRQERKVAKASSRLRDIEEKIANQDSSVLQKSAMARRLDDKVQKKTHPGLKVEILSGVYGYLGRNATENEALFKWVKDRDFWFHVRGYSGSHLWILRSDIKLGKDAPLPSAFLERAAKIALWNSKLKNSGSGAVDCTERRHLKKIKGEIGALKINQSQVLFVTLEEGFEKTLKWG